MTCRVIYIKLIHYLPCLPCQYLQGVVQLPLLPDMQQGHQSKPSHCSCHDLQHVPEVAGLWSQTRCIDSRSIHRIKAEGRIRQPELGCKTQMLTSVHHHIQLQNLYIYLTSTGNLPPVWKSTKTKASQTLTLCCTHSEYSQCLTHCLHPSLTKALTQL